MAWSHWKESYLGIGRRHEDWVSLSFWELKNIDTHKCCKHCIKIINVFGVNEMRKGHEELNKKYRGTVKKKIILTSLIAVICLSFPSQVGNITNIIYVIDFNCCVNI